MAQGYCLLKAVPASFALQKGGTVAARVTLVAPVSVLWSTGATDTWPLKTPILPAASYGVSAIDTTSTLWDLLAVLGAGLVLVKQPDFASWDTVLGGSPTWAMLAEIEGVELRKVPQL